MTQEKQFCRNCGKRDDLMRGAFWEPGLCIDCHRLPVIGIRYDVFTGKRIEPKPINCRICGQETIENVNGVCKKCWKADPEQEKSPTKLDHQRGKVRVLSDDISYLMSRIEHGSLASIAEHFVVLQEIHDLQHILADWDSYIGMEIARKAAHLAHGKASTESLNEERIRKLEHALLSYRDFLRDPTIAGDTFATISTYASALHARTRELMGEDNEQ